MKTRFLAFALLTLVAPPLPILAEDGNAILAELDRRMAPETYEMYRKLINIEPDGSRKEFTLYTVKKGRDQMAACGQLGTQHIRGRKMIELTTGETDQA